MSQYNKPISGGIFAKTAGVMNHSDYNIADYEGDAAVNIAVESMQAYGQNFWPQEYALNQMNLSINYGGVYWKNSHALTLLGVAVGTATIMTEGAGTAVPAYKLTTSMTTIPTSEYLSSLTRSSDSDLMQIWCAAGRIASDLNLGVSKDAFMTTDMGIGCYADASGDVIWFLEE